MNETKFRERKRSLLFGLPLSFTTYEVTDGMVTTRQGLFNITENDCYMYKVQDVKMRTSLLQRIFGISTLVLYTGDVTDKELVLENIRNATAIKEFLLKASEKARIERRTIHMNDIGAGSMDEVMDL